MEPKINPQAENRPRTPRRRALGIKFSGFTPLGLGVFFMAGCAAAAVVVAGFLFFGIMFLK